MTSRFWSFIGGDIGVWRVAHLTTLRGEPLAPATHVSVVAQADASTLAGTAWVLHGLTSNERYVTRAEKSRLLAAPPPDGPTRCAALIPIRKSAAWWALTQDERREIFEERSGHIATTLPYADAIARRLHHCRDLSEHEPFDFLTWFEYAPQSEQAFETLLAALRASEEWHYVEREIDIRLQRG